MNCPACAATLVCSFTKAGCNAIGCSAIVEAKPPYWPTVKFMPYPARTTICFTFGTRSATPSRGASAKWNGYTSDFGKLSLNDGAALPDCTSAKQLN